MRKNENSNQQLPIILSVLATYTEKRVEMTTKAIYFKLIVYYFYNFNYPLSNGKIIFRVNDQT